MSKPVTNLLCGGEFSQLMGMSKAFGQFGIPSFNVEALMSAQRKNIEAITSVNQAAFESMQTIARRQLELFAQNFAETTSMMNGAMSAATPQENVIRQAEVSKTVVDKCMANVRDITETLGKCNQKTMETVSTRLNEGLEELRDIIKMNPAQAA